MAPATSARWATQRGHGNGAGRNRRFGDSVRPAGAGQDRVNPQQWRVGTAHGTLAGTLRATSDAGHQQNPLYWGDAAAATATCESDRPWRCTFRNQPGAYAGGRAQRSRRNGFLLDSRTAWGNHPPMMVVEPQSPGTGDAPSRYRAGTGPGVPDRVPRTPYPFRMR